ncbi:MAG: hypothetical protein JO342_08630 [Solirubrobacterales bacterium]|nr:hypothetical protein [Solirubrobacterales bacterium]
MPQINALRTPGRSGIGALGVRMGVLALTLPLGAVIAFHRVLVGSVLGPPAGINARSRA